MKVQQINEELKDAGKTKVYFSLGKIDILINASVFACMYELLML